jgi:protein phosphatase
MVQQLVAMGEITPEQARQHPQRNMITRALGPEPNLRTDYNTVEFEDGARLIMCTDGMSNYLTDDELLEFIRSNKCEELTQKLIEHSKQRGGSDNITVAVISD